jgi:hypothetical protein
MTDQIVEVADKGREEGSRPRMLLRAEPRADGMSGRTSPPLAEPRWGEERALLEEEMEGEVASRPWQSSLQ